MKTTRQHLLAALRFVRNKPKQPKTGICTHVYRYMAGKGSEQRDCVDDLLQHYIKQWPVVLEEANTDWSPIPFFWKETASATLWANPLRHELLNWLIERVEEDEKNGTELGSNHSPKAAVD